MLNIEIEPTNRCNTICVHCPHDKISRPIGMMEWDTFQKVINRVFNDEGASPLGVTFTGMGDPLLNPLVYQFIKHISGRGFTSLTTNASALTEANAKKLVEAGLDQLWISFNGYEPVSYRLVMGGLSFEQAEHNLKGVLELSKGTRMQVGANISVIRPTQDKLVDIRNYLE